MTRSLARRAFGKTPPTAGLPVWRFGIAGGLVAILRCVGPTVLALFGIVSAGTAFVWANNRYDNYAWWCFDSAGSSFSSR